MLIIIVFHLSAPAHIASATVLIPTRPSTWPIGVWFVKRAPAPRQIYCSGVAVADHLPLCRARRDFSGTHCDRHRWLEPTAFLPEEFALHDALDIGIADNRHSGAGASRRAARSRPPSPRRSARIDTRLCITPTNSDLHFAASCVALLLMNSCAMRGSAETRFRYT